MVAAAACSFGRGGRLPLNPFVLFLFYLNSEKTAPRDPYNACSTRVLCRTVFAINCANVTTFLLRVIRNSDFLARGNYYDSGWMASWDTELD